MNYTVVVPIQKANKYPSNAIYREGLHNYQSHTAKRLFLTYRLKVKNYIATFFGVFIYAIIRPADIEVNFKLHCVKWDPLQGF
jgi:hypothetical protein